MTSNQIADELGVSRHALERFIKRNGIANLADRRKNIDRGMYRPTALWNLSNGHYKEDARV